MLPNVSEDPVWVLVPRDAVPEEWIARAEKVSLVRLRPEEAAALLPESFETSSIEQAPLSTGTSRAERARRRSPSRSGWDSLTEAERKVVALAAEGLTNPQIGTQLFVSPRTVATHLAHAFKKLGVVSRVELATLVTRRGRQ